MNKILIPGNVPHNQENRYIARYERITKKRDRIFLFAIDQKMQHLNSDFYGPALPQELNDPEYLFHLASSIPISAFAAHLGLIEQYIKTYPSLPYIAKLDGKTNLVAGEPLSEQLWTVDDVIKLEENTNTMICGVGYTIYLGSEHESIMMEHAARIVEDAHRHGLVAILWIYPRGKSVPDEHDADIIAGAAGVAASLDADIVKLQRPTGSAQLLQQAVAAAGKTKVIISGGELQNTHDFIQIVSDQMTEAGVAGSAIGRNIFQHSFNEAVALAEKLAEIIYR